MSKKYLDKDFNFKKENIKETKIIPEYIEKKVALEITHFLKDDYYEEYLRYKIDDLETLDENLKGELTFVISEKKRIKKSSLLLSESDKKNIRKMIKKLSVKEIVNLISQNNAVPKKKIYNFCLKIKNEA